MCLLLPVYIGLSGYRSLCAQILFHLQQRKPPVLPPLHKLFEDVEHAVESRPLHLGQELRDGVLEVMPYKMFMCHLTGVFHYLAYSWEIVLIAQHYSLVMDYYCNTRVTFT